MNFHIRFKNQIYAYCKIRLGARDYHKGWLKSTCPYCGRENKFGINISRNWGHCFRCGKHPTLYQLISYLEGTSDYDTLINILSKDNFQGLYFQEESTHLEIKEKQNIYLPENFLNISLGNSLIGKLARKYLIKRGFDIKELSQLGWGYCTKGKYMGYIIMPFYENNQLIYFNARLFVGNGPRYNNPLVSDTGLGKSFIIYNKDALFENRLVYLCEGVINAQTMGKKGIAFGGKNISPYQINELIKSPASKFIILLDSDAKDKALSLAFKLIDYKKVKVIFFPEGKDVNDLGKKKTLSLIRKSPYLSYSDLLKLKNSLLL